MQIIQLFQERYSTEKQIIKTNLEIINADNKKILKYIILGNLIVFIVNYFFTYNDNISIAGYENLRGAYLILLTALGVVYCVLYLYPKLNSIILIYSVYAIGVAYCIITSGFIMYDYVSVFILALVLQVPILYIDNSIRISFSVVLYSIIYLMSIFNHKNPILYPDEVINIISFCIFSIIVGRIIRKIRIENYAIKSQLNLYAFTDPLTLLGNRRKFFEDIKIITDCTALAMIDIDLFKNYNDTYGHQKGDECLELISNVFKNSQEQYPIKIYRYGGEEFIALITSLNFEDSKNLLENIRIDVENLNITHSASMNNKVTISLGIVENTYKENNVKFEKLISMADKALYLAKDCARNQCIVYND